MLATLGRIPERERCIDASGTERERYTEASAKLPSEDEREEGIKGL